MTYTNIGSFSFESGKNKNKRAERAVRAAV